MFKIDIKGHQVKLWQNQDGSWQASYNLDPTGFVYDDEDPTKKDQYELHHLIGHGENKALDLATQIENIKTDGKANQKKINQLAQKISQLIASKKIDPQFLPIDKALSIQITEQSNDLATRQKQKESKKSLCHPLS